MRAPCASLFALLLVPTVARAASYADLGTLERGAVNVALASRGFAIDPAPGGKIVGAIHVVNLDVFQPSDGRLLEWFNHFHRTTREEHVRRESLLLPGMRYDALLVDETMRNLRNRNSYSADDPPLSSIVAMVPIQAATPGTVDVLIVTRDVWSLRFNTNYNFELFALNLPTLSASLSENNLFGWRKQAAIAFIMDQGEMWLGPNYLDPNMLGTRLRLTAASMKSGRVSSASSRPARARGRRLGCVWNTRSMRCRNVGWLRRRQLHHERVPRYFEQRAHALRFVLGSFDVREPGSRRRFRRGVCLPAPLWRRHLGTDPIVPGFLAHSAGHRGQPVRPGSAILLAGLSQRSAVAPEFRANLLRPFGSILRALRAVRRLHAHLPHLPQPRYLRFLGKTSGSVPR